MMARPDNDLISAAARKSRYCEPRIDTVVLRHCPFYFSRRQLHETSSISIRNAVWNSPNGPTTRSPQPVRPGVKQRDAGRNFLSQPRCQDLHARESPLPYDGAKHPAFHDRAGTEPPAHPRSKCERMACWCRLDIRSRICHSSSAQQLSCRRRHLLRFETEFLLQLLERR